MLLSGRKRKRKSVVRFVFLWWTIHVCLCYIWCLASSRCDFRTDIISPNSTSKINRKQNIDYIFEMISLLFKIDFNDKETSALSRIYLGRSKTWFTDAMWILELTSDGSSCLRFLWLAVSLNSLSRGMSKLLSNKDRIVDHNLTTILLFPMLSISEILERSNF